MKSRKTQMLFNALACFALVIAVQVGASASCGDSLSEMAAKARALAHSSHPSQTPIQPATGQSQDSSIVGLWNVQFMVNGQIIQEAYQIWNTGGTEVHNPNVDPRTGNVCLGAWGQSASDGTYNLVHRVWSYDASGDFQGTIHLKEKLTLTQDGNAQTGSFILYFYDPSGNLFMTVPGIVRGERISAE